MARPPVSRSSVRPRGQRMARLRPIGLLCDVVVVLLFVGIGRSNHHHGLRLGGFVSTTWPFAIGLGLGWLVVTVWPGAAPGGGSSVKGGMVVTVTTVAVGMILRVWAGQGTAVAFVIVALVFLGATMTGWRFLMAHVNRRKPAKAGSPQ